MSLSLPKLLQYSLVFIVLTAASAAAEPCPLPGQTPMLLAELFFGTGGVGDAQWRRFLAREVTPRFPDGFTALDAAGQWRDPRTRQISRERSKLLIVGTANSPASIAKVEALAAAYRRQFHQQSVSIVTTTACAAF